MSSSRVDTGDDGPLDAAIAALVAASDAAELRAVRAQLRAPAHTCAPPPDVHDVSGCPLGVRCESCGVERTDLAVGTARTALGVLCLTLCPRCAAATCAPPVSSATAVNLVGQHAAHLGIDGAQTAALLDDGATS